MSVMRFKVVGIELKSRPFKNDPYEWDSDIVDKSYGTIGVQLRPVDNEAKEYVLRIKNEKYNM